MTITFNDKKEIETINLNRAESEELEQTGFCYDEKNELGVIHVGYEYIVVKKFDDYAGLNYRQYSK